MDFVNEIVIAGLCKIVTASTDKLCDIIDPNIYKKGEAIAMFEIKVEIEDNAIIFDPEYTSTPDNNGISD